MMPVCFLFTDVLQVGRETIAKNTSRPQLHPQVCDLIIHNPKYNTYAVTLSISQLYFIDMMFCLCFNLSWYRHWSDNSNCSSAHCCHLRYQEESQTGEQVTEQLVQYAKHAVNAFCVQLCPF